MSNYFPGPITAIVGAQGSGKTFAALKFGLQKCEELRYDLVLNFSIDAYKLYRYCYFKGFTWCMSRLMGGHFKCRSSSSLEQFLSFGGRHLYILDEAGVYLNSRRFKDISVDFLSDLAQIRHDCKLLWWIAQYIDMVDRVLRELTQGVLLAESYTRFNRRLSNTEIVVQNFAIFETRNYYSYLKRLEDKRTGFLDFFRRRRYSLLAWRGFLDPCDRYLFKCYKSFGSKVAGQVELLNADFYQRKYRKVNFEEVQSYDLLELQQSYGKAVGLMRDREQVANINFAVGKEEYELF